jgi:hypothetical protein
MVCSSSASCPASAATWSILFVRSTLLFQPLNIFLGLRQLRRTLAKIEYFIV